MNIEMLGEPEVSTTLTAPQRAAVALSSAQTRIDLAELVKKSANILSVTNTDGRAECHGAAMALVKARTTIEKTGKAAREDATAFSKAVIAEEKSLIAITAGEEARLLALRDKWDADRAAEKAEAERIESERITRIHRRIGELRSMVGLANMDNLPDCAKRLAGLMAFRPEGFDEFADEAASVLAETIASVTTIHAAKMAEEAERVRVKIMQEAERMKLAAERAEVDRLQAEAKAEQAKADAERRAQAEADAAELARQRAELAAAQAKLDADAKALQDARAVQHAAIDAEQVSPAALVLVPDAEPQDPTADEIADIAIYAISDRFDVSLHVARKWLAAIDWRRPTLATNPEMLGETA